MRRIWPTGDERFKFWAPLESWRKVRDRMHATICELGFDSERNTFTQSFGSSELDASLLLIPLVSFLPADDPRVRGTVAAIEPRRRVGVRAIPTLVLFKDGNPARSPAGAFYSVEFLALKKRALSEP
jgi:hypothetical protein